MGGITTLRRRILAFSHHRITRIPIPISRIPGTPRPRQTLMPTLRTRSLRPIPMRTRRIPSRTRRIRTRSLPLTPIRPASTVKRRFTVVLGDCMSMACWEGLVEGFRGLCLVVSIIQRYQTPACLYNDMNELSFVLTCGWTLVFIASTYDGLISVMQWNMNITDHPTLLKKHGIVLAVRVKDIRAC